MVTGIAPKFNEVKVTEYFNKNPAYADIVILNNSAFEASKDESSDIFLIQYSSQKMTLEKGLKLQAKKFYRIIFPGTLNNFQSYKLVVFSKQKTEGLHVDDSGEKYTSCENTLNSILVSFKEDVDVVVLVLWINK